MVICCCEQVICGDIECVFEQGVQDIVGLKMCICVGMGDCQGWMCIGYCSDCLCCVIGCYDVGWLWLCFLIDLILFFVFQNFGMEV